MLRRRRSASIPLLPPTSASVIDLRTYRLIDYIYKMKWLLLLPILAFNVPEPVFTSEYTFMDKADCRSLDEEYPEGDVPERCEGKGGYYIYTYYNLYGHGIRSIDLDGEIEFSASLTTDGCQDSQDYGNAIEWRMADGMPFAVIQRFKCLEMREQTDEETGIIFEIFEVHAEYLLVIGLKGFEHIDHAIDVSAIKNANLKARSLADEGYHKK